MQVQALAVYNGYLYVGGDFSAAGGSSEAYIAKWDGTSWYSIGTGLNSTVYALAVYNGKLYAGGTFTQAGGNSANYIASWNDTAWSSVGSGAGTNGVNNPVYAMAVYNGKLYVGGEFLYACGDTVNDIGAWDGKTWSSVDSGIDRMHVGNEVEALAVYNGNLYVGGSFSKVYGSPGNYIARWNGTHWSSTGSGSNSDVVALAAYNGKLYAGGGFNIMDGKSAYFMADWNDTIWTSPTYTPGGSIYAFTVFNRSLIVGGRFSQISTILKVNNIAAWNDTVWSALGSGLTAVKPDVYALCVYGGFTNANLYAGGHFSIAGADTANNVAEWGSPLAINEISSSNTATEIYPNPNNGKFTIRLSVVSHQSLVEFYNMLGEKIYSAPLPQTPKGASGEIDLSNQSAGIYLYHVTNEAGKVIGDGKFIIE